MVAMLTDGVQYFDFKLFNESEFEVENEKAREETDGNIYWLALEEDQILDLLKRLLSLKKIEEGVL